MRAFFPKWLYQFALPQAIFKSLIVLHSWQLLFWQVLFFYSHINRCGVASRGSDLHFPFDSWCWVFLFFFLNACLHLYVFLGSFYIFCPFLNWVVCFLIVEFWDIFVYSRNKSFYGFACIFSQPVACLSIFLIVSLGEKTILALKSRSFIPCFVDCASGVVCEKSLPNLRV